MKRKTWLAALLTLCLITLPALTALADETGMESLDEIAAEAVDEIIADPVDEITAEAVDQDIDAVTMDLGDADGQGDADRQGNSDDQGDADDQSALLPEFTAVDAPATDPAHETTPDGSADAASDGNTDAASDGNTDAASDGNTDAAGDIPAADDALAADESDAVNSPASDNAPVSGEPAAPAEPLSASLEPETEQFSAAAMLAGDGNNEGHIHTYDPTIDEGNTCVNCGYEKVLITDSSITITLADTSSYVYDNSEKRPAVTVTKKVGDTSDTLVEGENKDYTVAYSNNINAGENTAKVTVTGRGDYKDSRELTFSIGRASVAGASIGGISSHTYDGQAYKPEPTVTVNGRQLIAGTDFTYSYSDDVTNAGDKTVTINGINNYKDSKGQNYTITRKSISTATLSSIAAQTYTGNELKPGVTVTLDNKTLDPKDYNVRYENNINA